MQIRPGKFADTTKSVLLVADNEIASGLRYLMSSLIKENLNANMVIFTFDHQENLDQLISLCRRLDVAIVGMSVFSSLRLEFENIAKRLKKEIPHLLIVCGGPDVNSNYRKCLDWADYVCVYDGETAFPALCKELLAGTHKWGIKIPNIYYEIDGKVHENGTKVEMDLDVYPFPFYSDTNIYKITNGSVSNFCDSDSPSYNVYASRGCPYKCSYCANHVFANHFPLKKNYRVRSVGNVIEELVTVVRSRPGTKSIAFHDEQFGAKKIWFEEFLCQYKERIGLPFFVQMNPLTYDYGKLKELKAAGLSFTSFGMQSGSERIRKIYERPESLKDIKKANEILYRLKVPYLFDIIVDNPYESFDDLIATLDFLLELRKPFVAKTFDLTHLPETNLTKRMLNDGLLSEKDIEGNFSYIGDLTWRVRDSKVSLHIDEKFIVAIIQLTGNIFVPNVFLKVLRSWRSRIPLSLKVLVIRIVLSNWYETNIMRVNVVVTAARDKGIFGLIVKIVRRFVPV